MKAKFRYSILLLLSILLSFSCNRIFEPTVIKDTRYLITSNNESYVYIVTKIQYERTKDAFFESIDYKLFQDGADSEEEYTSYVKYRRTKKTNHSYTLKKIEGSTEISKGPISFSWSYASDNSIYLYIEEGTKIKKIS